MNNKIIKNIYTSIVSLFVAFVLVFQLVISIGPIFGVKIGTLYWPLVNYAMYSNAYHEGDTVNIYRLLEATTESGTVVDIPMDELGVNLWHYRILGRDLEDGLQEPLDFILQKMSFDSPLSEIRITSFPIAVTRDGPERRESEVLVRIPVSSNRVLSR
jgi:hypothetical protein